MHGQATQTGQSYYILAASTHKLKVEEMTEGVDGTDGAGGAVREDARRKESVWGERPSVILNGKRL